jgi:hypothetical protein
VANYQVKNITSSNMRRGRAARAATLKAREAKLEPQLEIAVPVSPREHIPLAKRSNKCKAFNGGNPYSKIFQNVGDKIGPEVQCTNGVFCAMTKSASISTSVTMTTEVGLDIEEIFSSSVSVAIAETYTSTVSGSVEIAGGVRAFTIIFREQIC